MQISSDTFANGDLGGHFGSGKPGLTPSDLVVLGRKALMHVTSEEDHQEAADRGILTWQLSTLAEIKRVGTMAAVCEKHDVEWRSVSTLEQLEAMAKSVVELAASDIVKEFGLPIEWLRGQDGSLLGVNGLSVIAKVLRAKCKGSKQVTEWIAQTSAVETVTKAVNETKPHKRSKGARRGDRRRKAQARKANPVIPPAKVAPVVPVTPTAVAITGKIELPKPGTVIKRGTRTLAVCNGRHGNCRALVSFDRASVSTSFGAIKRQLGLSRDQYVQVEDVPKAAFCPSCAPFVLKGGSITVTQLQQDMRDAATARKARRIADAKDRDTRGGGSSIMADAFARAFGKQGK